MFNECKLGLGNAVSQTLIYANSSEFWKLQVHLLIDATGSNYTHDYDN